MSEIDQFESLPPSPGDESVEAGPSLGQVLHEARLARGLSVDDVVHALKFSARQIEAIEADRLDIIPGIVFLRGLVRSYARLLKLDPEPLLNRIDAQVPAQEPDIRAPENMGNAAPKGGIHKIPPLVALSVLLLIAAGAMFGWHYLGAGVAQIQVAVDSAKSAMQDFGQLDAPKPDAVPPVPVTENAGSPTSAPQPELMAAPVVPAPAQTVDAPPSVEATAVAAELPADARRLSFSFEAESWIEVKDASGVVILTGIYQSGTQSVTGRAPFEVVIGNASVVAMRDDGRLVDLKPYTRAEVARLTRE